MARKAARKRKDMQPFEWSAKLLYPGAIALAYRCVFPEYPYSPHLFDKRVRDLADKAMAEIAMCENMATDGPRLLTEWFKAGFPKGVE